MKENLGLQSNIHQTVFLDLVAFPSGSNTTRIATCNEEVMPFNNDILIFYTAIARSCHVFLQLIIVMLDMTMHKISPTPPSTWCC